MKTNEGFVACPDLVFALLMRNRRRKKEVLEEIVAGTAAAGMLPTKGDGAVCHVQVTYDQQKQPASLVQGEEHVPKTLAISEG